jgi:uncharacterized protein YodC (DUF2158 family)
MAFPREHFMLTYKTSTLTSHLRVNQPGPEILRLKGLTEHTHVRITFKEGTPEMMITVKEGTPEMMITVKEGTPEMMVTVKEGTPEMHAMHAIRSHVSWLQAKQV